MHTGQTSPPVAPPVDAPLVDPSPRSTWTSPPRRLRRGVLWCLLGILAVSATGHLVGLHRDLPSPEPDEPFFVLPAVQMAAHGSLDPHWFGHPGSTVIGPLALAFRAREVILHGAPVTGAAPAVANRFRSDPESFYLIGRGWAVLLGVVGVGLVFAVGRRVFDDTVGLLGAAAFAVVPLAVSYGRIVRTDSAGICFGMLSLWAILRALERPTTARFALAGGAIGLAVASRYFFVALIPVLVAAWWTARRRTPGSVPTRMLVAAGACTLGAFAVTTPYFFLDWPAVHNSLTAETIGTVSNDHHWWLDNLVFYLTDALPNAMSIPTFLLGVVGLVRFTWRSHDPRRLLLAGFVGVFLAGICAADLQWTRWIIPVIPVLCLFAAALVLHVARRITATAGTSPSARRITILAVSCAGVVALTAMPATALIQLDRAQLHPSTRQLMGRWIVRHLPVGTPIAEELKSPQLPSADYPTLQRYDLPSNGTVADYLAHGYRYLLVNGFLALRYRIDARRFPEQAAFYWFLRRHALLLEETRPDGTRTGPHLKLYLVDPADLAVPHTLQEEPTVHTTAHPRLLDRAPFYPVGNELLSPATPRSAHR